jgi:hypothetical protein
LVGLDAATKHIDRGDELYSVFLSGTGPLVAILQEALARDKVRQERLRGRVVRKGAALSQVRAFIQNVHHFRDECLVDAGKPPVEHGPSLMSPAGVEPEGDDDFGARSNAQFTRLSQFSSRASIGIRGLATVICLVGGGQEINTGEAGISEWLDALN